MGRDRITEKTKFELERLSCTYSGYDNLPPNANKVLCALNSSFTIDGLLNDARQIISIDAFSKLHSRTVAFFQKNFSDLRIDSADEGEAFKEFVDEVQLKIFERLIEKSQTREGWLDMSEKELDHLLHFLSYAPAKYRERIMEMNFGHLSDPDVLERLMHRENSEMPMALEIVLRLYVLGKDSGSTTPSSVKAFSTEAADTILLEAMKRHPDDLRWNDLAIPLNLYLDGDTKLTRSMDYLLGEKGYEIVENLEREDPGFFLTSMTAFFNVGHPIATEALLDVIQNKSSSPYPELSLEFISGILGRGRSDLSKSSYTGELLSFIDPKHVPSKLRPEWKFDYELSKERAYQALKRTLNFEDAEAGALQSVLLADAGSRETYKGFVDAWKSERKIDPLKGDPYVEPTLRGLISFMDVMLEGNSYDALGFQIAEKLVELVDMGFENPMDRIFDIADNGRTYSLGAIETLWMLLLDKKIAREDASKTEPVDIIKTAAAMVKADFKNMFLPAEAGKIKARPPETEAFQKAMDPVDDERPSLSDSNIALIKNFFETIIDPKKFLQASEENHSMSDGTVTPGLALNEIAKKHLDTTYPNSSFKCIRELTDSKVKEVATKAIRWLSLMDRDQIYGDAPLEHLTNMVITDHRWASDALDEIYHEITIFSGLMRSISDGKPPDRFARGLDTLIDIGENVHSNTIQALVHVTKFYGYIDPSSKPAYAAAAMNSLKSIDLTAAGEVGLSEDGSVQDAMNLSDVLKKLVLAKNPEALDLLITLIEENDIGRGHYVRAIKDVIEDSDFDDHKILFERLTEMAISSDDLELTRDAQSLINFGVDRDKPGAWHAFGQIAVHEIENGTGLALANKLADLNSADNVGEQLAALDDVDAALQRRIYNEYNPTIFEMDTRFVELAKKLSDLGFSKSTDQYEAFDDELVGKITSWKYDDDEIILTKSHVFQNASLLEGMGFGSSKAALDTFMQMRELFNTQIAGKHESPSVPENVQKFTEAPATGSSTIIGGGDYAASATTPGQSAYYEKQAEQYLNLILGGNVSNPEKKSYISGLVAKMDEDVAATDAIMQALWSSGIEEGMIKHMLEELVFFSAHNPPNPTAHETLRNIVYQCRDFILSDFYSGSLNISMQAIGMLNYIYELTSYYEGPSDVTQLIESIYSEIKTKAPHLQGFLIPIEEDDHIDALS